MLETPAGAPGEEGRMGICSRRARGAARRACAALLLSSLVGCAGVRTSAPRVDVDDNLVLGCPKPISSFDPPKTLTGTGALIALAEVFLFCEGELITHGEDREFQERLKLQERLERINVVRARDLARMAPKAAPVFVHWDRPPR
jgi:hypothetical protein